MNQTRRILYMDMDNVLVDFAGAVRRLSPAVQREYAGRLDEVPGLFSTMEPVPGAVESYEILAGLFDTYILSTAPWDNPGAWTDKLLWVKEYIGKSAYKRLILSHHKDLNRGDFLVDDRTRNGADRFEGTHIHFGTEAFPDWDAVVAFLEERVR